MKVVLAMVFVVLPRIPKLPVCAKQDGKKRPSLAFARTCRTLTAIARPKYLMFNRVKNRDNESHLQK